jgi:hypothetical protein
MRVIAGGNSGAARDDFSERENMRKALLGKVHVAIKDLGWPDHRYRNFLTVQFGVPTAAALDVDQLDRLVGIFKNSFGWKPKQSTSEANADYQIVALRYRVQGLARKLKDGEKRLPGLCKKVAGVECIEWCTDEKKLKRLLAVMGNYYRQEFKSNF